MVARQRRCDGSCSSSQTKPTQPPQAYSTELTQFARPRFVSNPQPFTTPLGTNGKPIPRATRALRKIRPSDSCRDIGCDKLRAYSAMPTIITGSISRMDFRVCAGMGALLSTCSLPFLSKSLVTVPDVMQNCVFDAVRSFGQLRSVLIDHRVAAAFTQK